MYNGIINVYKEPGYTSHDVVARLRGITHQKKIGHTGTLDPAAEGVLCVCMGAATRVCDMITDETKEYEAVVLLGVKTDTLDTTGTILKERPVDADETRIKEVISHYKGEITQIPPMYSALKVDGRKLCDLARAGVEVERKPRKVTIYDIEIKDINLPRVTVRVVCSKGTYIRTLADDIGEELGCGAAMEHLYRTRVGRFSMEDSVRLDRVKELFDEDRLEEILITPADFFGELTTFTVNDHGEKMASNGNMLAMDDLALDCVDEVAGIIGLHNDEQVRIMRSDGYFYGVYRYSEKDNILKPDKMFFC